MPERGLSPRVRGNQWRIHARRIGRGSIPARAGEPRRCKPTVWLLPVYPRACGGTPLLTPLTNRYPRSIPARAGEPSFPAVPGHRKPVYPRACGGTSNRVIGQPPNGGLSPRVRGNHGPVGLLPAVDGSIPARAGEPTKARLGQMPARVYPRACGGTITNAPPATVTSGLSPRVRGNQCARLHRLRRYGSIPARAGEPVCQVAPPTKVRVYPRACGGTVAANRSELGLGGLSPRVRGNQC